MPAKPHHFTGDGRNRPLWYSREVDQTPIADLKPYSNKVKAHSASSIRRIANSIEEFGFVMPVVIDEEKSVISGHGRIEAAKRLRLTSVPTICADHLTPAQVKAYRIADNKLADLSDWNPDALRIEFKDLINLSLAGDLDFDLEITGFKVPEIDILICGEGTDNDETPEMFEEPDPSRLVRSRPGDLWVLGEHRLFCGNSLEAQSYETLMMGVTAQMVFTDPPYNVAVNGHVRSGNGGAHREFAMASGEMSDREFKNFLMDFIAHAVVCVPKGGIAMICMDGRHIEDLIGAGKSCGLELINLCVWNKTNGGMGSLYRSKHELICVFKKPGATHINNVELGRHGRNRTNVWDYAGVNTFGTGRDADLADHPTVKPTALVADALMDVSHPGDVVLDVFGGSGATLLAAEKTKRRARLIELDPSYCDVAIRRWQDMTGQKARHAMTGKTWDARADELEGLDAWEADDVKAE